VRFPRATRPASCVVESGNTWSKAIHRVLAPYRWTTSPTQPQASNSASSTPRRPRHYARWSPSCRHADDGCYKLCSAITPRPTPSFPAPPESPWAASAPPATEPCTSFSSCSTTTTNHPTGPARSTTPPSQRPRQNLPIRWRHPPRSHHHKVAGPVNRSPLDPATCPVVAALRGS
jgi:hypothetical protein